MSDPALARLPVRDNIKRRIRMVRQNNDLVSEPKDLQFASVPPQLTQTHREELFLRSDTGPGTADCISLERCDMVLCLGEERILIFASPEQLQILQSSSDFLVDGTFKVVPAVFYQLYIIHAIYRDHVVPVIYALLRKKSGETYHQLIDEILKVAPNWTPRSVMMDFEQASINAFHRKFPNVALSGCYFHLRQSIHRKLQVR